MVRVAVVGLGKMGLSHLAMLNAHRDVEVAAVCDSSKFILQGLAKYTGLVAYSDYAAMLRAVPLDAVLIATPSAAHSAMVEAALDARLHVFCEKPFCLSPATAVALAARAADQSCVGQVGYHNRYVASFAEAKRLVDAGALGSVHHVLAEAYGPVVLKPKGSSWRTQRVEGGGCLYDYAAHPLNLVNWLFGEPQMASGVVLNPIYSSNSDDEVYATLHFERGVSAQISVNWSDPSVRKMTTRLTIWGSAGKLTVDRQELQLFIRDEVISPAGYRNGWSTLYTTELTAEVDFYLRGEEYSAQLWAWIAAINSRDLGGRNSFAAAAATDRTLDMLVRAAPAQPVAQHAGSPLLNRMRG